MMLRALMLVSTLVSTSAGDVAFTSAVPSALGAGARKASLTITFTTATPLRVLDGDTITITATGAGAGDVYTSDGSISCQVTVGGEYASPSCAATAAGVIVVTPGQDWAAGVVVVNVQSCPGCDVADLAANGVAGTAAHLLAASGQG